ncbi:OmpA family protein [Jannaschia rubra]|uniref:OmpA family protein n=1 Tax=Jannaschia rubra TaxID=282197 RepID=UPI00248FBF6C|nr:OmpA family protein [Jannaschia rubra]
MIRAVLMGLALTGAAQADGLVPPERATVTLSDTRSLGSHRIATGPFDGTLPSVTAEGTVTRRIWRQPLAETTLKALAPLRAQLKRDGWTEVFECVTRVCGGFDFRFEIDVAPAPEMFVDLADFRYLAARKGDAWTTVLVSRSGELGYVQTTRVDPGSAVVPEMAVATPGPAPSDVAAALAVRGRAILPDLDFPTGTTSLPRNDYPSLAELAAYLEANPDVRVALVGHTDATGGAAGNLAVSKQRAESVRALLTGRHGIAPGRVEASGVGYLAPIARNDTETGRQANRRVEVVIISTE